MTKELDLYIVITVLHILSVVALRLYLPLVHSKKIYWKNARTMVLGAIGLAGPIVAYQMMKELSIFVFSIKGRVKQKYKDLKSDYDQLSD